MLQRKFSVVPHEFGLCIAILFRWFIRDNPYVGLVSGKPMRNWLLARHGDSRCEFLSMDGYRG